MLYDKRNKRLITEGFIEDSEWGIVFEQFIDETMMQRNQLLPVEIEDDGKYPADQYQEKVQTETELPERYIITRKVQDLPDDRAKAVRHEELKRMRDEMTTACIIDLPGIGKIDGGREYLLNIMTLVDICPDGGSLDFVLADNTPVKLTKDQLKEVKLAIQIAGASIYSKYFEAAARLSAASVKGIKKIKAVTIEVPNVELKKRG